MRSPSARRISLAGVRKGVASSRDVMRRVLVRGERPWSDRTPRRGAADRGRSPARRPIACWAQRRNESLPTTSWVTDARPLPFGCQQSLLDGLLSPVTVPCGGGSDLIQIRSKCMRGTNTIIIIWMHIACQYSMNRNASCKAPRPRALPSQGILDLHQELIRSEFPARSGLLDRAGQVAVIGDEQVAERMER